MKAPLKTIKVQPETDEILLEIKKRYELHSRDEAIRFMRAQMQTPQEMLKKDLSQIQKHLLMMGREDVYKKVALDLRDAMMDKRLILLRDEYFKMKKCVGKIGDDAFILICDRAGIEVHERERYMNMLMEELDD